MSEEIHLFVYNLPNKMLVRMAKEANVDRRLAANTSPTMLLVKKNYSSYRKCYNKKDKKKIVKFLIKKC